VCISGNMERYMKEIERERHRKVWNGLMLGNSMVAWAAATNCIDRTIRSEEVLSVGSCKRCKVQCWERLWLQ
jgi:hypothetical protein